MTPVALDSWNRSPQGSSIGAPGVNYQMSNNIPPPNIPNTGYISGPNMTTPSVMGVGQPLMNNGYPNSQTSQQIGYMGQPTGQKGQPAGQISMGGPTQNPWINTNPWGGPPVPIPPQGMRGGGGPYGEVNDPWRNTNPWSTPPVTNQAPIQRTGSYY
jgi:hypothetical protein